MTRTEKGSMTIFITMVDRLGLQVLCKRDSLDQSHSHNMFYDLNIEYDKDDTNGLSELLATSIKCKKHAMGTKLGDTENFPFSLADQI